MSWVVDTPLVNRYRKSRMHAAGLTRTEYLEAVKAAKGRHRVPRTTSRGRVEGYCGHVPGAKAHSISTTQGMYAQLAYEVGAGLVASSSTMVGRGGEGGEGGGPLKGYPDLELTKYGDSAYRGSALTGGSVSGKPRADGRGTSGGAVPGGTTKEDGVSAEPEHTFVAHPAAPLLRGVYSPKVGVTKESWATTREGYVQSFLDRRVPNSYTPTADRPARYLAGKAGGKCKVIGGRSARDASSSSSSLSSAPPTAAGSRIRVPKVATPTLPTAQEIAPIVPVVEYVAPNPQRTSASNGLLGTGYTFNIVDRKGAVRDEATIPPGYTGYYTGRKYMVGT